MLNFVKCLKMDSIFPLDRPLILFFNCVLSCIFIYPLLFSVTVTQEKELLVQDLTDSRDKWSCLDAEIDSLLKSINDLTREKEEYYLSEYY